MSMSLSMMVTSTPRASSAWLATWPKRPKPITSTLPSSPLASSTPSIERTRRGMKRRATSTTSGVSTIDSTMMAVRLALTWALIRPTDAAAAYSTNANSPPWAISTARSSASPCGLRITRATT